MLALGDAVAINKSLFAYRLHGNNTVGCNNLLSNRKGIYKNFIKFKNRVKNCKKIYVDEAERAIYLKILQISIMLQIELWIINKI